MLTLSGFAYIIVLREGSLMFRSPDTARKNRIPPGQNITDKWPVLHYGMIATIDISEWTLTIYGLVKEELKIGYQQFIALPRVQVFSDIHYVAFAFTERN